MLKNAKLWGDIISIAMKNLNTELKLRILNEIRNQITVNGENPSFVPFKVGLIPNLSPKDIAVLHKIFNEIANESGGFKGDKINGWEKLKKSSNPRNEFIILHHFDLKKLNTYQENLESANTIKHLKIEKKNNIGEIYKGRDKIFEGQADRRPFRLVSFLNDYPGGATVDTVFEKITSGDDKRDKKANSSTYGKNREKVVKEAVRNFFRGGKAKGCVKFYFKNNTVRMHVT